MYLLEKNSNTGTWSQGSHILPEDIADGELFGWSVAIDGDLLVMGDKDDQDRIGSFYIYHHSGSTWMKEAKLDPNYLIIQ